MELIFWLALTLFLLSVFAPLSLIRRRKAINDSTFQSIPMSPPKQFIIAGLGSVTRVVTASFENQSEYSLKDLIAKIYGSSVPWQSLWISIQGIPVPLETNISSLLLPSLSVIRVHIRLPGGGRPKRDWVEVFNNELEAQNGPAEAKLHKIEISKLPSNLIYVIKEYCLKLDTHLSNRQAEILIVAIQEAFRSHQSEVCKKYWDGYLFAQQKGNLVNGKVQKVFPSQHEFRRRLRVIVVESVMEPLFGPMPKEQLSKGDATNILQWITDLSRKKKSFILPELQNQFAIELPATNVHGCTQPPIPASQLSDPQAIQTTEDDQLLSQFINDAFQSAPDGEYDSAIRDPEQIEDNRAFYGGPAGIRALYQEGDAVMARHDDQDQGHWIHQVLTSNGWRIDGVSFAGLRHMGYWNPRVNPRTFVERYCPSINSTGGALAQRKAVVLKLDQSFSAPFQVRSPPKSNGYYSMRIFAFAYVLGELKDNKLLELRPLGKTYQGGKDCDALHCKIDFTFTAKQPYFQKFLKKHPNGGCIDICFSQIPGSCLDDKIPRIGVRAPLEDKNNLDWVTDNATPGIFQLLDGQVEALGLLVGREGPYQDRIAQLAWPSSTSSKPQENQRRQRLNITVSSVEEGDTTEVSPNVTDVDEGPSTIAGSDIQTQLQERTSVIAVPTDVRKGRKPIPMSLLNSYMKLHNRYKLLISGQYVKTTESKNDTKPGSYVHYLNRGIADGETEQEIIKTQFLLRDMRKTLVEDGFDISELPF